MPFSRYGVLLGSLVASLCVSAQVRGQDAPTPAPTQTPAPTNAPKKVWTNQDVTATHGGSSVPGGSGLQASANRREFDTESNGASFVNPKPGQVVHPGEPLQVDLAIDSGITLVGGAGILSPMGMSSEIRKAPPYSFTFMVPDNDSAVSGGSPLIGSQPLYADGAVAGRLNNPDLAWTTVDVEEPDLPLALFAAGETLSNYSSSLSFFGAGVDDWIRIFARFPNGHELDVTRSTYLQLASSDPNVVRVAEEGSVISVGAGKTSVTATYTLEGQQKRLLIPVSVTVETRTLTVSPATVDFGDVPVGTTSPPRQVTVTNNSLSSVKIYTVQYTAGPENCSNRVLAPGESCNLTVTLSPGRPGAVHTTIYIDSLTVVLLGNGT